MPADRPGPVWSWGDRVSMATGDGYILHTPYYLRFQKHLREALGTDCKAVWSDTREFVGWAVYTGCMAEAESLCRLWFGAE